MKLLIPIGAAVAALVVTVSAQDSTVRSQTKISADDAKVVAMTGCLRQDALTGRYNLVGTMASGDQMETKSTVKTDVDGNDVTTKSRTETKVDGDAVATAGVMSTYPLIPRSDVELVAHVGHQVQITAVAVEPGKGDADIKIQEKTTIDPENGPDRTGSRTTKIEVPKSPAGSYSVVSVKAMPGTCPAQ